MNITQELFSVWAVHSALVLVKTLLMSLWTAKTRFANKTFANPEDIVLEPGSKVDYTNPNIERIRRSHLVRKLLKIGQIFEGYLHIECKL